MNGIEVAFRKVRDETDLDLTGYSLEPFGGLRMHSLESAMVLHTVSKQVVLQPDSEHGLVFTGWRGSSMMTVDDLKGSVEFYIVVAAIGEAYMEDAKEEMEQRKRNRELADAEREAYEMDRARLVEARKQRLLTEFLGEAGRIRLYRSTTFQPVIVEAVERPFGSGEYEVDFKWINDHDYGRRKELRLIRIFDVKVGGRYHEVWNDGDDDLGYKQLKRGKVKKFTGWD